MLPDHVLSTEFFPAQFRFPRNIPRQPLVSYEYGGVALNDASQGLRARVWRGEYLDGSIVLSADGVAPQTVLTIADVLNFDFTFDQNMRVAIAYQLNSGSSHFYWFDSTIPGFTTLDLPAGSITPRCAIDDNRDSQIDVSDIILAYVREGHLYAREQRDRYTVEYDLYDGAGPGGLVQIGMNRLWRFQFQLSSSSV